MADGSGPGSLRGFCFPPETDLNQVKAALGPLLLKGETLYKRESMNCLEIPLSLGRHQLFSTYLTQRFNVVQTYSGENANTDDEIGQEGPPCRVEVTKLGNEKAQNDEAKWDPSQGQGKLGRENSLGSSTSIMSLLLQSRRPGKLQVDGEEIQILCEARANNSFHLEVRVAETHTVPNTVENGYNLSTSVTVQRNQKINLGDIVRELKNKRKNLGIPKGIDYQKVEGTQTVSFFLEVK